MRDDLAAELLVAIMVMAIAAPFAERRVVGVPLGVVSFVLLLRWVVVVYEPEVIDS